MKNESQGITLGKSRNDRTIEAYGDKDATLKAEENYLTGVATTIIKTLLNGRKKKLESMNDKNSDRAKEAKKEIKVLEKELRSRPKSKYQQVVDFFKGKNARGRERIEQIERGI